MPEEITWIPVCAVERTIADGGVCVVVEGVQIAVFHIASLDRWYAVQNRCPHWNEMVLSRAMTGDAGGEPKIACPMHKKTFALGTGACLSGEPFGLQTFAVRIIDGAVCIEKPSASFLAAERALADRCGAEEAERGCHG